MTQVILASDISSVQSERSIIISIQSKKSRPELAYSVGLSGIFPRLVRKSKASTVITVEIMEGGHE